MKWLSHSPPVKREEKHEQRQDILEKQKYQISRRTIFQHVTVPKGIKRNILLQCYIVCTMDDIAPLVRVSYEIFVDERAVN